MSDGVCTGFEPQNYLRDRCKKCFRLRSKHGIEQNQQHTVSTRTAVYPTSTTTIIQTSNLSTSTTLPTTSATPSSTNIPASTSSPAISSTTVPSSSTTTSKKEKRRSWRDKTYHNQDEGPENEIPDSSDTTSVASFKSATSKGLSSAKSMESLCDSKSMVTAISSEFNEDERATTPTEASDLNHDVANLKHEIARLQEEVAKLKEERERWTLRRAKKATDENEGEQSLIDLLEERLIEAENLIQDYRDENTVLKCELRDLQENYSGHHESNQPLSEKLKATESLCEELMIENENLKADVKDLQQEIEEMQDQYREEEIEEFRELQRELEQNAKNCRVLQFKLRKSERLREQLQIEKDHAANKLKAYQSKDENENSVLETTRTKELESELRIAKEVSVRLHNELEAAEDKRYKMEDEIFYLKEKIRELQTQHKWREARNKAEQIAKRQSLELSEISMSSVSGDELSKELRDVLERETDLREQLRFTEEDLKRTQNRLQEVENENEELLRKLTKLTESGGRVSTSGKQRPPMTRSISDGNAQIKLEMATAEVEHLSTRVEELERKNTALTKKMLEMEIDTVKKLQEKGREDSNFHLEAEIEKDMNRFMSTIHELEKKNNELQRQLDKMNLESNQNGHVGQTNREKSLNVELRNEQERRKELENSLTEYKALISKSDNQKLIAMATKVEMLTNQLALSQERYNVWHKKSLKDGGGDEKYLDTLKQRCEALEKQIAELKAEQVFNGPLKQPSSEKLTADEIEQCCVVLASVEAQTNRICKQMEKLDVSQQKDERRRSLSKETSATMIADLANVMSELKFLHQVLEPHKIANATERTLSPKRELGQMTCKNCKEKEAALDSSKQEVTFYKKKNKELTNQILQTEDRWSVEIQKQTHGLTTQIRSLESQLTENKGVIEEQGRVIDSQNATLAEKHKALEETQQRCAKLQAEVQERVKAIQEMEKEYKNLKEWEIKYKKLEELTNREKEKIEAERAKVRTEMSNLKKRTNDMASEFDDLKKSHNEREVKWKEEQENYEKNISNLKEKLDSLQKDEENDDVQIPIPVQNITYRVTRKSSTEGIPELKEKISQLERKNGELELRIKEHQFKKDEIEAEMSRCKIAWDREKESLLHKVRQDEKVRGVEIDALQQRFTSRMSIMENTNKTLNAQLSQVRRERDFHKEAVANYEKKMDHEQKRMEADQKQYSDLISRSNELEKKVKELEAEVLRLSTELSLTKEAHKADKKLWAIEKNHYNHSRSKSPSSSESGEVDRRITEDALSAAESVQKQYAEYQKFYAQEVGRLNNKIKELTHELARKDDDMVKALKELNEQIKVLEIDQKNLLQAKEMQASAREVLQADQERLLQIVQQTEIQKLSRKYKISAIIDQLNNFGDLNRNEQDEVILGILGHLNAIKDEDSQNAFTTNDIADIDQPPVDNISQSSLSIRSAAYPPIPHNRYKFQHSYSLMTPQHRSFSIESNSTWDSRLLDPFRGSSPIKKLTTYPDPPPNFLISKDKVIEYDKDGRLHYVPKCFARSASYDRGVENGTSMMPPSIFVEKGTCTDDDDIEFPHSRSSSTGTNILYKIRREELSKGGPPSVKMIAKAFESMEKKDKSSSKRGFFNIRKSRSVDTNDGGIRGKAVPHSVIGTNTLSVNNIDNDSDDSKYATIGGYPSRGGRNPFKNMGSRIVERVRRSLSRSGRKSRDRSQESATKSFATEPQSSREPSAQQPPPSFTNVVGEKQTPNFEKPPIKKATPATPVKVKTKAVKKPEERTTKKPTPT